VSSRPVPLFWRLFVPNATVLCVACVILWVEPANGRIAALGGGAVVMLVVNLLLIRHAVAPLTRLTALMHRVDPLRPGERIPPFGPPSEVTMLTEAFNEMLDRLESERRDSGLRALREREGERRRIAAELHDGLGQTLTAIALQLSRFAQQLEGDDRPEAEQIRDAILETIEDVRRLARDLRPEGLDELGLVPALTNLVERIVEQTGIPFERHLDRGLSELGPDQELVIYRVAQEAITNAIRHANASAIDVALRRENGGVVLEVSDDGEGITHRRAGGTGFRTMRERALTVGGRLDVRTSARAGTAIRLTLPSDGNGAA
jgi:two-component system sensor histidine kinase UhpB